MEAAYVGVRLWAQAVEVAGSTDPPNVRVAMKGQTFDGPGGTSESMPMTGTVGKRSAWQGSLRAASSKSSGVREGDPAGAFPFVTFTV